MANYYHIMCQSEKKKKNAAVSKMISISKILTKRVINILLLGINTRALNVLTPSYQCLPGLLRATIEFELSNRSRRCDPSCVAR